MKLYLVQHGKPMAKEVDPDRPLSDEGRADVGRIAAFLNGAGVRVERLFHSGKLRARQTAQLLATAVSGETAPEVREDLAPRSPVDDLALEAGGWDKDTMLVGHLPHLGKIASRLVAGAETDDVIRFRQGGVLCLERDEENKWRVAWMVLPELL